MANKRPNKYEKMDDEVKVVLTQHNELGMTSTLMEDKVNAAAAETIQ